MKYTVFVFIGEDEYAVPVSVRADASDKTKTKKCVTAIVRELWKHKAIPEKGIRYCVEKPNIWINGAVRTVWIEGAAIKPIKVGIESEEGWYYACP